MSVQERNWTTAAGKERKAWWVRWQEGGKWKSKTFRLKRDADTFDAEVVRRRRLGTLAQLDAGAETLDDYVSSTWTPTFGALIAEKTQRTYSTLYATHLSPSLGNLALRDITTELISRWQAERLSSGAGPVAVHQALGLLGNVLQRAAESQRIPTNPARLVRKAKRPRRAEVRPLAPVTVEAIRASLSPRDAMLVSLMAYSGLRPGEALALRWGDVRDKTLIVQRAVSLGTEKATKTGQHRTVRLLAPLAVDLREYRMLCGRPGDNMLVIPSARGTLWTDAAYRAWRRQAFARSLQAAGVESARPYDLRHSFASLLIHEGRSVIYVARQLGHGAGLTLSTYGHVIEELEDSPHLDAESAIQAARSERAAHELHIAAN